MPSDLKRIFDFRSAWLLARSGEQTGGDQKQLPIRLSQVEFVRRWCLHVLPSGYTRTRRFGGWSNRRQQKYIEIMKRRLNANAEELPADEIEEVSDVLEVSHGADEPTCESCPKCGSRLIPHKVQKKPSWAQVMASRHRPMWYQRL